MSGLQLVVSDAGRAALPNAQHTGTQAVTIASIGVTAQGFTATRDMDSLPGEIKRLSTISGVSVAPDTLHVTLRDDSGDVYSMRGFALYLQDGTLFAAYGQSTVILEKSAQAMLLLATDTVFADIDAASIVFGDATWTNPPATTEVQGVVELATIAEVADGIDDARAITPRGLRAALNTRFGIGAPSDFVKGLLHLATAALFRAQLGIRSAALRDEGAGNGLDSDLLDGQHGAYYRQWVNLQGVPAAFPPAAHTQAFSTLTGVPATASRWPSFSEVTGKPATYPSDPHVHSIAQISGLQVALDGKQAAGSYASLSSNTFSGGQTVRNNIPEFVLDDVDDEQKFGFLSNGGSGVVYLGRTGQIHFRPNGRTHTAGVVTISSGRIDVSGNQVFHAGNFDPASKAAASHEHSADQINSGLFTPARLVEGGGLASTYVRINSTGTALISRTFPQVRQEIGAAGLGANQFSASQTITAANAEWRAGVVRLRGVGDGRAVVSAEGDIIFRPVSDASVVGQMTLSANGNLTVAGTVATPALNATSSDKRLKRKIKPLRNAMATLMQYQSCTWEWRDGRGRDFGFIAQWHERVTPEAVYTDERGMKYVRYGKAEPLIVAALQEHEARILALESRLASLEVMAA